LILSKRLSILILLIFLFSSFCFSQKYLILEKFGNVKSRTTFKIGDEIVFGLKNYKTLSVGIIENISDSSIVFINKDKVPINEISLVIVAKGNNQRFRNSTLLKETSKTILKEVAFSTLYYSLIIGGLSAFETNYSDNNIRTNIIVAGTMIPLTSLIHLFRFRKYKIGNKWHLKILDFS